MALNFERLRSTLLIWTIDPLSQNWERGGSQSRSEGHSLPGKIDFKRF
jgi:hypothetical protein